MKKIILGIILLFTCIEAKTIKINNNEGSYTAKTDNEQIILEIKVENNGYIQVDKYPSSCGTVNILSNNGKNIGSSQTNYGNMNKRIEKGKVKIQIIPTYKDCKVHYVVP